MTADDYPVRPLTSLVVWNSSGRSPHLPRSSVVEDVYVDLVGPDSRSPSPPVDSQVPSVSFREPQSSFVFGDSFLFVTSFGLSRVLLGVSRLPVHLHESRESVVLLRLVSVLLYGDVWVIVPILIFDLSFTTAPLSL